jgi:cell division protein FtsQ
VSAPSRMRRALLAVAGGAAALALAAGAWLAIGSISEQPVKRVVFSGDVDRIARADLDALSRSIVGESRSNASLAAMREAARRVPWVREATVRRRIPDAVEIALEAHVPAARWGDGALVSTRGEVFNAEFSGDLPRLAGPEGTAAAVLAQYRALAPVAAPLGARIAELRYSPRGAWQAVLDGGLTLELGRGDVAPRLARFAAAWPKLDAAARDTAHADLRYANGFALRARVAAVPSIAKKKK